MKRILLPTILILSNYAIAQQSIYSQSTCEQIKQAQHRLYKEINTSDSEQKKQQLSSRTTQLAESYTKHCDYVEANTGAQETPQSNDDNDTKTQSWPQVYQAPPRCAKQHTDPATKLWCDEIKLEQRASFESQWSSKSSIKNQPSSTFVSTSISAIKESKKAPIIQNPKNKQLDSSLNLADSSNQPDKTKPTDKPTSFPIWLIPIILVSVITGVIFFIFAKNKTAK